MEKKIIAVRNLRKALYFGGSMATFSAATGLAVAIPLYNKIQAELRKNFTKLADLSGFMTQLISKLGVSDASFTKELSNGFQVVYENGKTKIFKTVNGEKTLVMNTNADGTIGSAARYDGVAAKQIISVVTDAVSMLGSDAHAMEDILGPIAEEAEQTSVEIESAITGTPKEVLLLRNKVAGKTPDEINAAIASGEIAATPQQLADAKAAADKAKQDAEAFKVMDAAQRAEAQKKALEKANEESLKIAYIKYMYPSVTTEQGAKDQLDANGDKVFDKSLAEVQALFNQEKTRRSAASVASSQEKTTEKAIAAGPNTNLINTIISSPARFVNVFSRTFGFHPASGSDLAASSGLRQTINNVLETALRNKQSAITRTYNTWTSLIGNTLLGYSNNPRNWNNDQPLAKRKVQATTIVNTMNSLTSSEKGLIVMAVKVTFQDGTVHNGFIVGKVRSDATNILDWENARAIFDFTLKASGVIKEEDISKKLKLIQFLSRIAGSNVHPLVKKSAIEKLMDIAKPAGTIPAIQDDTFLDKLTMFSNHLSSISSTFVKNYFSTITNVISQDTLYNSKKYDFDVNNFIKATELVSDHDVVANAGLKASLEALSDKESLYTHPRDYFGTWMKKLETFITINGPLLPKQINNLAHFYDLIHADSVNSEIQAMADSNTEEDWDIITQNNQAVIDLLTSSDPEIRGFVDEMAKNNKNRHSLFELTKMTTDLAKLKNHIKQFVQGAKSEWTDIADHYWELTKLLLTLDAPDITDEYSLINEIHKKNIHNEIFADEFTKTHKKFFTQQGMYALEILASSDAMTNKMMEQKKDGKFCITPDALHTWTDEIGKDGFVSTFSLFKTHISQLMNVTDDAGNSDLANVLKLIQTNPAFIGRVLTSPKDDISYEVKDILKLIKIGVPDDFDLNDDDNIKKVQAASGVSQALDSHSIAKDKVDAIATKVRKVLVTTGENSLTHEEFEQVVEYTNTVFSVFGTNTQGAIEQLEKVLDPTTLKANVDKITKFNVWIKEIEKTHTGTGPITQKEIEDYVWTYKLLMRYTTPGLPWAAGTSPILTSIIPTSNGDLYSVIHNGGGLVKLNEPTGEHGASFSDVFTATDTPLAAPNDVWSSTGGYDPANNAIISGNLMMGANGKIIVWNLNNHQTKELSISNGGSITASQVRNIIVTNTGKIILVDATGHFFVASHTMSEVLTDDSIHSVSLQAFASSITGLTDIFAIDTFVKDGTTYAVISNKGGAVGKETEISVINLDTQTLVSRTPIGDYFFALSVDKKSGYAYGIGSNHKQLWRIDILNPANTKMLLALDDLTDQHHNSPPLEEDSTTFRGIFYDNAKKQIVVSSGDPTHGFHLSWISDNTQELDDIFNYLMKH